MKEKLDEQYWGEIDNVIKFASRVCLNYDCLRAIAFELNGGLSFKEAIKDLNIVNLEEIEYVARVELTNGMTGQTIVSIDMFSDEEEYIYIRCGARYEVRVQFSPNRCKYDVLGKCYEVDLTTSLVNVKDYDNDEDDDDDNNDVDQVKSISLRVHRNNSISYSI